MEVDNIPEEWGKACVEDLGMIQTERIDPTDYPETEFELWSVPSYETGSPKYVKGEEIGSRKQIVQENDVLLSRINPRLNRVWVVTEQKSQPQIASTEWVVFRCQEINSRFLRYALLQPHFKRLMCDHVSGVGGSLSRTRKRDLRQFEIGIPPLPEQRRIADRLDAIQSHTQATGKTLDQVPDRIEEYRQSVLNAAFTGRLTADWREDHPDVESAEKLLERILDERREQWEEDYRAKYEAKGKEPPSGWKSRYSEPDSFETNEELFDIPDEWTWTNLDHLVISGPQNGLYLPKSKYGSGTPILRIDDYQIGWSRSAEELQKVEAEEDDVEKYSLNVGDLVINRVNSVSHLGKCLLVEERNVPSLFESNMMRLRPTSLGSRYYLTFYLQSARGRRLLIRNAKHAVNQASINQGDVKGTPVPLPPADEQKEIVRRVRQRLDKIDEMALHVEQAGERLDHLDRSVLAKAFRGELVETEAERARRESRDYETAEELLESVRDESSSENQTTAAEGQSSTTTQVDENGQFEMKVVEDDPDL